MKQIVTNLETNLHNFFISTKPEALNLGEADTGCVQ